MTTTTLKDSTQIAGQVHAECTCCVPVRMLVNHVALGATRMACPESHRTYLDRGDGLFQPDGESLSNDQLLARAPAQAPALAPAPAVPAATSTDLLGDRPTRTPEKTRISLERATFA